MCLSMREGNIRTHCYEEEKMKKKSLLGDIPGDGRWRAIRRKKEEREIYYIKDILKLHWESYFLFILKIILCVLI